MERFKLLHGDCRERMRDLEEASVDAIVTDPPYGIRFMGQAWDGADIERRYREADLTEEGRRRTGMAAAAGKYDRRASASVAFQVWTEEWASEAFRVLKPGGYLLCFSSTRTYHRMVCGVEDAGFEIRDQIGWAFGSGFPKSHNGEWGGTALKPAWEPIVLARKPLVGTVEENWKAHGTGALNIDACRIAVTDKSYARNCSGERGHEGTRSAEERGATDMHMGGGSAADGRWPANLVHDGSDEVIEQFPREAGAAAPVTVRNGDKFRGTYGTFKGNVDEQGSTFHGDSGNAARFFYCAKATREDRDEGLSSDFEKKALNWSSGTKNPGSFQSPNTDRSARNFHPTVKPTDLMRWLCRLVTPQGGVILDPFTGSGSTGKAAMLEGFRFIGIELSDEYLLIAKARIEFALRQGHQPSLLEAA